MNVDQEIKVTKAGWIEVKKLNYISGQYLTTSIAATYPSEPATQLPF